MKIRILRSGGIAGHEHVELAAIDTTELDGGNKARIEKLAERLRTLSAAADEPYGTPEMTQYDVEITAADEPSVGLIIYDDNEPENTLLTTLNAILSETAAH